MKLTDRLIGISPWIIAAFILAGVVHLASILIMPQLAPRNAFARISDLGAPGIMTLVPQSRPGREVLPLLDPALAISVCRYDLANGPVRLRASVARDQFVSLSFHARRGSVFYAMTDRAASRGRIDVLVLSAGQLERAEAGDNEDEPSQDLRLLSPETEGFILARALARDSGAMEEAQARLKAITCEVLRE